MDTCTPMWCEIFHAHRAGASLGPLLATVAQGLWRRLPCSLSSSQSLLYSEPIGAHAEAAIIAVTRCCSCDSEPGSKFALAAKELASSSAYPDSRELSRQAVRRRVPQRTDKLVTR
ncbi:hypothetical protein CYMTET_6230 [Cymbomonas tetramitiformis]|uniref:Uncharacterized protein n=1 Tax=Cymbomonas tetramitiformis TaxID=36881 RepID=A0AAE0LIA1_9CHLO|nr:hypothetical protein CYMTET_6230 [Cymbomonas tetramitiformis]